MKRKEAGGYRLIFGYLGIFLILIGIICLIPLFLLIPYSNEISYANNFIIPGCSSIGVGILLSLLIIKRDKLKLGKHQDSVLLVVIWLAALFICAVPFLLGGMTFTDSVFETASGFATTGLTRFYQPEYGALTNVHMYQLYRAILLFFGGVGLVLIISSALSDRFGLKLYIAEGHNDKLLPNLRKSATMILGIYILYIILGSVAYSVAGMPIFDSICHSISALATGGFSTKAGGLIEAAGTGNLLAIEIISCVLMVLGGTNFLIHMFLLRGKFKNIAKDSEVRFFIAFSILFITLFFGSILLNMETKDPLLALRQGSFTFFSALTTTGFSNVANITSLGQLTMVLIILVTIVGGGMGSTAGGVKQFRFVIAIKTFYWSMKAKVNSNRMVFPHYVKRFGNNKEVTSEMSFEAFRYLLIYLFALALGTILIMFLGNGQVPFLDAFFEFSNAISSAGLSCGLTSTASIGIRWVLIVGMFLGRLEIFAVYFAIYRVARDILRKETV